MGKDPAVLWYWGDWAGGTSTISRHLKGCYMDLLNAQFNSGHLSIDEIKTVLGSDFGTAWPTLQKKFIQDKDGLYYNERLFFEISKRKNFTKSRRENAKGSKHMHEHMENVNEIENVIKTKKAVRGVQGEVPSEAEFLNYCKEKLKLGYAPLEFSLKAKYEAWVQAGWIDGNGNAIQNWKTKIQNTIPFLKPMQGTAHQVYKKPVQKVEDDGDFINRLYGKNQNPRSGEGKIGDIIGK